MNHERRGFLKRSFWGSVYGLGASYFYTSVASSRMALASITGEERGKFATPTFKALVDTVIPGGMTDPSGKPGGLEAGTVQYVEAFDKAKYLPFSLAVVHFWLSAALDTVAFFTHGRGFAKLGQAQRVNVLKRLLGIHGAMPLLMRLLRAPYYTGAVNRVGWENLGYPGPTATGFLGDYSFNEATAYPHPRSVMGNLP